MIPYPSLRVFSRLPHDQKLALIECLLFATKVKVDRRRNLDDLYYELRVAYDG